MENNQTKIMQFLYAALTRVQAGADHIMCGWFETKEQHQRVTREGAAL